MVPNGKLIGKQLGDRYPREDMLLQEHTNGPGGRLSGLINNSTLTQGLIRIFCTYFSSLSRISLMLKKSDCGKFDRHFLAIAKLVGENQCVIFATL